MAQVQGEAEHPLRHWREPSPRTERNNRPTVLQQVWGWAQRVWLHYNNYNNYNNDHYDNDHHHNYDNYNDNYNNYYHDDNDNNYNDDSGNLGPYDQDSCDWNVRCNNDRPTGSIR